MAVKKKLKLEEVSDKDVLLSPYSFNVSCFKHRVVVKAQLLETDRPTDIKKRFTSKPPLFSPTYYMYLLNNRMKRAMSSVSIVNYSLFKLIFFLRLFNICCSVRKTHDYIINYTAIFM